MKKTFLFLFLLSSTFLFAQKSNYEDPAIIPYPIHLEKKAGQFELSKKTTIVVDDDPQLLNEARYLQALIKEVIGANISFTKKANKNSIEIKHSSELNDPEAYNLNITPNKISISASDAHGVFNAIQTIRQLFPIEKASTITLPAISVQDKPAYTWRGMHLDVSRHFFNIDYLKKHIDRLAYYKFNKFHLHLTDDQGWRIEIKQYPKLTEEGAWRTFNNQDSVCIKRSKENPNFEIDPRFIHEKDGKQVYGGFYTQEEMKDLIAYAESKHIEIIPEIDMPGHMMAAISAYPELVDGNAGWGEVFSVPLCVCKENVYTFSKNVLKEIIDLFPSKYIHIGADEVDKTTWKESPLCKDFMEKHNIENVDKLQSYFVHEMQDFVETHGKTLIAWDEILEGGANPTVTVMYWRGWVKDAPKKSVAGGNEVIMTPTNPLYFDYENNNTSVYNVYSMDVVYKDIPADKAHLIKGAQANVWSEWIPSEQQADFQTYPRMLALAERIWTNNTNEFDSFSKRLLKHYPRLDAMGVNYRLPDIEGFTQENVFVGKTDFMVNSPLNEMKIHYTMDGSIPTMETPELTKPIAISEATSLKMALFSTGGTRGEIYNLNFKPTSMKKAVSLENAKAGLSCDFFDKYYKNTKEIQGTPDETFVIPNIQAPKETKSFGLKIKGYIDVPETGIYSFFFTCDDGGVVYIDNELVIDNDGQHSAVLKSGQAALEKGAHPFQIDFLEGGGGYTLKLQYSFNGSAPKDIPDSWFKH
jgi:hexosaminidase